MKFLAAASLLFLGALAVPASQCGECDQHHHPGGNNPGGNNPGGNNPGGNNPGGNNPGGNNPGGNNPGGNNPGGNEPACPKGLYSVPQCCSVDVLGVADLDCKTPGSAKNAGDFQQSCAAAGKHAKCCVLPVAGQSLLCVDPSGGNNPGGNNPGGNNPGGNNPGGNNPGGNNPGGNNPGGNEPACPTGLYSNPQCCSTDVLGVADLDCKTPASAKNPGDFKQSCSASGKQAKCCAVPVAGQALLCTDPSGGNNPGGNNPGGNNPGGNNPGGNNPGGNNPGGNNPGGNEPACPAGLYSNPQCCSTDVLGVADLDCKTPSSAKNPGDFKQSCSASGKQAKCCAVPVAGQALLCTDPSGGNPGGNNPGGNNPGGNNPGGNNPGGNNPGGNNPGGNKDNLKCPGGLYSNKQCCSLDVLGLLALDCGSPTGAFGASCTAKGKQPMCCAIPVAGQDVLCVKPIPA